MECLKLFQEKMAKQKSKLNQATSKIQKDNDDRWTGEIKDDEKELLGLFMKLSAPVVGFLFPFSWSTKDKANKN